MIFKRVSFYLALIGIIIAAQLVMKLRRTPPAPPALAEPARSPFPYTVAATGIIEASRENVRLGAPKGGLVAKVLTQVGAVVKKGDTLIQLDDREARARAATARAQVEALRAALKSEQVMMADASDQFERVQRLQKEKVATEDELARKQFQLLNWQARVAKLEADIKAATAEADQADVELDLLLLRAPRAGAILQLNIREGEYAETRPIEPLLVLGEVERLQVRADVDEQNAPMVQTNQPAVAFLKGSTLDPIPLRFVRIEPYVIPKKSLTGDSTERVDTRVLQIIYELERAPGSFYVGQQVDVFIQRTANPIAVQPSARSASADATTGGPPQRATTADALPGGKP